MAERRMFSKTIIDSDAFLDMPLSVQALYFHLSMRADDDGFINNPKKIQRMIGCREDDMKLLIAKSFVIPFESGVCVIKHWKIHNYIRKDRYTETNYKEEKNSLVIKENGAYTLDTSSRLPNGIPTVDQRVTQDRLGKDRLGKDSKENILSSKTSTLCKDVVNYLNLKAKTRYKSSSKKTQSLIKAREQEGFTIDDFKIVIDKKVKEWTNTEFEKFIRPETLFSNKFEGYLNQKGTNRSGQGNSKFFNFEEREYDYDAIEKKLLGWDEE